MDNYLELAQYARTPAAVQLLQELHRNGGDVAKAAKAVSLIERTARTYVEMARRAAAIRGYSPAHGFTHAVPETHVVKGVSTMHTTPEGKPQWVKADLRQEAYNEYVKAAIQEFIDAAPKLDAPKGPSRNYSTDVIPWVQLGDAHLGMLAQAAEVGEDFDLAIAERELCGAISILLDEMPACERAVLNDLGDATHYSNFAATTAASGNILDYDSRFPKMIDVYVRVMRFIVEKMLTKARVVDVIINQGNHSRENDIWMARLLRNCYPADRVNVLDNRSVYIAYRMGRTLVMVHHGDKCKADQLAKVMVRDFRKDYGETEYHYIDRGHVHHKHVTQDVDGIVVESWSNLATNDRWAHDAGYRANKSISVVLRSRTYGEIGRRTLSLLEIRDRLSLLNSGEHAATQCKPVHQA